MGQVDYSRMPSSRGIGPRAKQSFAWVMVRGIQFLRMQKPAPQGMRRTRKRRRTLNTRNTDFSLLCNEKSPAEQVLAALGLGTALQRCDASLEF